MNSKSPNIIRQNKNIIFLALAVALILLVLRIAMQFNENMVWSITDFVLAGALLFGTGLVFELIVRKAGTRTYRAAVGVALAAALLLVWVSLAVGIIGSENNPANLMYVGVLAVLIVGALIARLRPAAMTRVLFATALAQAAVTVIALSIAKAPDVVELVMVNGFFVALWAGSALLFQRAKSGG